MHQIHLGVKRTRVADDVRASLTALRRSDQVVGGVALVDVQPPDAGYQFDALIVTPNGVLIIAGVDLPGPVMQLTAPLRERWAADRWPLIAADDVVNPGSPALSAAEDLAGRISAATGATVPVGVVLAVGPYVDSVTTPGDLSDDLGVLVLFPKPATLRDAIGTVLPPRSSPCSVEQARAVLRLLAPQVPVLPDAALTREGFLAATPTADSRKAEHPAPAPRPEPEPVTAGSKWTILQVTAVLALLLIVVLAIALIAG